MQPKPIKRSLNPNAKALSECDLNLVVERPSNPMSHDRLFRKVNIDNSNNNSTDKVPFTFSNICESLAPSRTAMIPQTHPL